MKPLYVSDLKAMIGERDCLIEQGTRYIGELEQQVAQLITKNAELEAELARRPNPPSADAAPVQDPPPDKNPKKPRSNGAAVEVTH